MNTKNKALLSLSLAFIILGHVLSSYLYAAAAVLLFVYLAFPSFAEEVSSVLEGITRWFGKILSHVLLTIAFWLVVVPVGLLYRWVKKNPLFIKNEGISSTYTDRYVRYTGDSLTKPW